MNSLQIFNNGEFSIRTLDDGGQIWFVARDVAAALEYSLDGGTSKYFANVPDVWKGRKRISTPGGEQEMLCLTEQGLYFFLGRSDKKKALPYQMWIAGNVVPSIRRTAGIKDNQLALAMDKIYRSYTGQSALSTGEIQLEAPVKEQALTPSEIAEHLGLGQDRKDARVVNTLLANAIYQRKIAGKYWEPIASGINYCVMLDTNKRHSDGTPIKQVKWLSSICNVIELS